MDLIVPNDKLMNSFFRNKGGGKFEEVGFEENVALREDGDYISGMGVDFRDLDNDGYPDIVHRGARRRDLPPVPEHRQRQLHGSHTRKWHDKAEPAHGGILADHRRFRQRRLERYFRLARARAVAGLRTESR